MRTWQKLKQNPSLFKRYFVKEYVIKACRKFFEHRGYHELESPILAYTLPQERYLDVLEVTPLSFGHPPFNEGRSDRRDSSLSHAELVEGKEGEDERSPACRTGWESEGTAYIIPTTETYNKKILAAGLGEHFVIAKVCRGTEQISSNHSPEFTMLEWYHIDIDYKGLMKDVEELFIFIKKFLELALGAESTPHVKGQTNLTKVLELEYNEIMKANVALDLSYQGLRIDLSSPWERLSVVEALNNFAGIELTKIQDVMAFRNTLKKKRYNIDGTEDWQTLFEWVFAQEIEPKLKKDKPTFVYDFPKQVCVLTKPSENNPLVCEKVELYIASKELANGYTELLDWKEQEKRFREEENARKQLGKREVRFDHDLIEALKSGMPKVSGIGVGLDRVALLMADAKNINEVNYFPFSENF